MCEPSAEQPMQEVGSTASINRLNARVTSKVWPKDLRQRLSAERFVDNLDARSALLKPGKRETGYCRVERCTARTESAICTQLFDLKAKTVPSPLITRMLGVARLASIFAPPTITG